MKLLKYLILFLLIISWHEHGMAQTKITSFTDDPVKFIDELEVFFQAGSLDKKEAREFVKEFAAFWKEGKFNENHKQAAYEICNMMLKKRLRPFPDFKSYLTSMMNFVSTNQPEKNFISWQGCLIKILNGKAIKNYADYLLMSENLFASNSFYKTASTRWATSNNNYLFEFDSVPKVIFPDLNLKCYNSQSDSGIIYNTKGTYYPSLGKFIGKGGKVNWVRTGIDENTVYAELKNYQIVMKNAGYTADSVVFYNKSYFNKPLLGMLNEKVISESEKTASFPRFDSYNKRLQIKGLTEQVDYDGGFSMRGAKFIGSGSKEEEAYLIFRRNDQPFLIAASKSFIITKDKIISENASINIRMDQDSIYHPGLQLKFLVPTKQLSLLRNEEGTSKTPYFNSYHAIDMYFEELSWKLDEPKIDFKMLIGNTQDEADFESSAFYKQDRYTRLQGIDAVHPLVSIKNFVKSNGDQKVFYGIELGRYMKFPPEEIKMMLLKLSNLGFIIYDVDDDRVTVKDRLFSYLTARAGKSDYDALSFHSVIPGKSNASLNLLNDSYELNIQGVSSILLSDSQNVFIYPKDGHIVLKKNRDFNFAGVVNAGRFTFFGKQFGFEYNKFKILLTDVDSLQLKVQSIKPDENGNYPLVRVKSVIQNINGDLLIDRPNNKSGVQKAPEYPVFNSSKDAYVFYDKKSIQNGTYPKDKFYFHLEPFTIDSLDNFTNAGLNFKGDFVSAGVFPQFTEVLTLQPDYSLGFVRSAPTGGFPLYGGKALFNNQIKMSHQGLRGDGTIDFITSTTKSNDFIFYPDSMNATAQNFDIKEQKGKIEFPQVHGENVYVHWMPYNDLMRIHKKDKPFTCYNGQAEFNGRFDLTSQLLSGKGIAEFFGSELESNLIKFKQHQFDADTSDFRLKSVDASTLAFSTDNVKSHIDFEKREGEFKSNGRGSIVRFPVNQYICYMENFKWHMDKNDIELGGDSKPSSNNDLDLSGPEFISVHPKQDSLRFQAPSAKYDLKKYVISAKEVKYINVADARIYPDSGNVIIEKNAVIRTLNNSRILANTVTKYHNVYNATVNIFTRKSYSGSGKYDYVDELKNKQAIYFSNINVDTTYQTYAETAIDDSAHFALSPNYDYKGRVKFISSNQFLNFTGSCKIQHACEGINKTWFNFSADINPDQIYIPVSKEPTDISNDNIAAAIMLTNDSTHVYSAFLSKKVARSDIEVLPADGFLFFDKASREYRISNKEKLVERSLPGNLISINVNNCVVHGEGKINLGGEFGQVKIETVGSANHFLISDSTAFDIMVAMDFFFDDNAMDKMAEDINGFSNLQTTDFTRSVYEKGLRELMGKEKADKLISQINLYGSFKKFPDELKRSLLLNDIKLQWNSSTRSYISVGKIGIGNINRSQINKFVDGKIEVVKKRGGDVLNVYLELDEKNWYYFNYTRGLMQAISSNEGFNNVIKELKPDKREMKIEKGQAAYQFNLSTLRKKNDFLKKTGSNE